MAIPVHCQCGHGFRVEDKYALLHVRCPKCGTLQVVTGQPEGKERTRAPHRPPPAHASAAARSADAVARPSSGSWLLIAAGILVLVLGGLVLAALGVYHFRPHPPQPAAPEEPPAPIVEAPGPAVKVSGTVTPGWHNESVQGAEVHYRQWRVALELANETGAVIDVGDDLFLIESNSNGSSFDGVAVFRGQPPEPQLSVLGLLKRETDILDGYGLSNYEIGFASGQSAYRKGNNVAVTPATNRVPPFRLGSLAPGKTESLQLTLDQGTVLQDEYRQVLRVVLPEVRVRTPQGEARYRLLVKFPIGKEDGKPQPCSGHEWIKIERDELARRITSADADSVTRALAANWLAGLDADAARAALKQATPQLRDAKLIVSFLHLMTRLKGDGLGPYALEVGRNADAPADLRRAALEYVGTVHYDPAFEVLVAAAAAPDETVARGAINGLGADGSPRAVEALLNRLKDDKQRGRHLLIAQNLARTPSAEALRGLEALAAKDHLPALYALAEAAPPQCFAFFEELAGKEGNPDRRALALHGLRCSDPDRAGPLLMKLLSSAEAGSGASAAVVQELIALSSPRLAPDLSTLAAKGNLPALQVLAGYRDESALASLQDRARNAQPAAQMLALQGLVQNWPKQSVAIFKEGLAGDDTERLALSAEGLARSGDPAAASLLLKALQHPESRVRGNVAASLARLPPETGAPRWVEGLLATDDDQVALVLVNALIHAQWKDRAVLPRLGEKLKASKGDLPYQIIRLLRHVAGNPMGPATYFDYQKEPDAWMRKWSEWLAKN